MENNYYEKNKEELKEKKRLYRLNNAEKIKAYYIKYKNECPERLKEIRERAAKKWKEKHPEDYKRLNTERVKKNYERVGKKRSGKWRNVIPKSRKHVQVRHYHKQWNG